MKKLRGGYDIYVFEEEKKNKKVIKEFQAMGEKENEMK